MHSFDDDDLLVGPIKSETVMVAGRTTIRVPAGVKMFQNKRSGIVRIESIPYQLTELHLKFVAKYRTGQPGSWFPSRTFEVHEGIGVDGDKYVCANQMMGHACPICEVRIKLKKTPSQENNERAWALRTKQRQMRLLYERDIHSGELKPELILWEDSLYTFGKQLTDYVDAADPEDREAYQRYWLRSKGYTIKLNGVREKTGGGGEFTKWYVHEFKRRDPLPPELFAHGVDLDAVLQILPYEELRHVFLGSDEGEETQDRAKSADTGRVSANFPPRPGQAPRPAPQEKPRQAAPPPPAPDDDDMPPPPRRAAAPAQPVAPPQEKAAPARRTPPPPPPQEEEAKVFASMDTISFDYKGQRVFGKIQRVDPDKRVAQVVVEGWAKPVVLDFEEMTLEESDSTFDQQEQSSPNPAPASGWDDDDDGQSFQPKQGKAPAAPDDDSPPPPRKRR